MIALARLLPTSRELDPMAMTFRTAEVNTIEADEGTTARDPTDLAVTEAETVVHGETVMQESRAVGTAMNDMIAALVHHQE